MWNENGDVGDKHVPVRSRGTVIYLFLSLFSGCSSWGVSENEGESEEGEINRETALADRSIASELRWLSAVVMR